VASKYGGRKDVTNTAAPKFDSLQKLLKGIKCGADLLVIWGKLIFYRKKRLNAL
jgi:hypothetical protein